MMAFGETELFATAFKDELHELLKSENPCIKRAAQHFLSFAK